MAPLGPCSDCVMVKCERESRTSMTGRGMTTELSQMKAIKMLVQLQFAKKKK